MGDKVGRWQIDNAKKAAQAQAMWELLAVVGGHLPSSPDEAVVWPADDARDVPSPPQPAAVTSSGTPGPLSEEIVRHLASLPPVKRARAADNPVGWLGSLAVTFRLGPVDYVYDTDGPQHAPTFTCTASLAGQASTQSSSSKNQARVAAAESLVQALLDAADMCSTMEQADTVFDMVDAATDVSDRRRNQG
jgi:ribonuclease R